MSELQYSDLYAIRRDFQWPDSIVLMATLDCHLPCGVGVCPHRVLSTKYVTGAGASLSFFSLKGSETGKVDVCPTPEDHLRGTGVRRIPPSTSVVVAVSEAIRASDIVIEITRAGSSWEER